MAALRPSSGVAGVHEPCALDYGVSANENGDACVELARLEFQGRGGPADREAAAALCAQARAAATPPRAARLAQLDELEAALARAQLADMEALLAEEE